MSAWTDEQIMDAITRSIAAHDFDATVALVRLLAIQAPGKAQSVLDAIAIVRGPQ